MLIATHREDVLAIADRVVRLGAGSAHDALAAE